MTAERVGDHLFELLPAQRGEIAERALTAEAPRPSEHISERGQRGDGDGGSPREDDHRVGTGNVEVEGTG